MSDEHNEPEKVEVPAPNEKELHAMLKELQKQDEDFRIMGDGRIIFTGSMKHGFAAKLNLPQ